MPILFGTDAAQILAAAMASAGGVLDATLTVTTSSVRQPGQLAGGTHPVCTDYRCKGFVDRRTTATRSGTLVRTSGTVVTLLGDTLPDSIVPRPGDTVTIEGTTYTIVDDGVSSDPFAAAYELQVEA